MIDLEHLQKNEEMLVVVSFSGRLTTLEYKAFLPHFESEIRDFSKLRILFDAREVTGWEVGSLWRKLSFDSNHRTVLVKIAIVGTLEKTRWLGKACLPWYCKNLRTFSPEKMDDALAWIEG